MRREPVVSTSQDLYIYHSTERDHLPKVALIATGELLIGLI